MRKRIDAGVISLLPQGSIDSQPTGRFTRCNYLCNALKYLVDLIRRIALCCCKRKALLQQTPQGSSGLSARVATQQAASSDSAITPMGSSGLSARFATKQAASSDATTIPRTPSINTSVKEIIGADSSFFNTKAKLILPLFCLLQSSAASPKYEAGQYQRYVSESANSPIIKALRKELHSLDFAQLSCLYDIFQSGRNDGLYNLHIEHGQKNVLHEIFEAALQQFTTSWRTCVGQSASLYGQLLNRSEQLLKDKDFLEFVLLLPFDHRQGNPHIHLFYGFNYDLHELYFKKRSHTQLVEFLLIDCSELGWKTQHSEAMAYAFNALDLKQCTPEELANIRSNILKHCNLGYLQYLVKKGRTYTTQEQFASKFIKELYSLQLPAPISASPTITTELHSQDIHYTSVSSPSATESKGDTKQ
ncbi:MAG: hypothetical protein H0X51_08495 [Parachlamydiaceae bacterium]|nr:hypothetical protein [Parachlamydiaceae bacterium]